ncbi:hypothetical protein [Inhella gelatinilytica]|uniref:Uncharacterized protein n=1 Tax=Inhella gelatinilytica TaxID=2795030 RepID=A0A931NER2_9BURK|nr:hypothetical protein [Inhella gelatinilytica]MBH9553969.1 hypothetical protein [Inhella gelatinilytica]
MEHMEFVDEPSAEAWCGAVLKLCDEQIEGEGLDAVKHPEQWAFVLWCPDGANLPARRPDAWGLDTQHPVARIAGILKGAPIYELEDHETLWSSWLRIFLVCQEADARIAEALQDGLLQAIQREDAEFVARYGATGSPAH